MPSLPTSNPTINELLPQFKVKVLGCFGYTSAHGYGRIAAAAEEQSRARRWFWFIVCCASFVSFMIQLSFITKQYWSRPLKTRIRISHNERIPFPQVTICNLNIIRKSHFPESILNAFPEVVGRGIDVNSTATSQKVNQTTSTKPGSGKVNTAAPNLDDLPERSQRIHKVLQKLSQLPEASLMSYGHQLEDMIMTCRYNYLECLKDDMRQFWTRFWHRRYGNCYTFNKGIDENGLDTEIMTTSQAGRGLTLEINTEEYEYISELSQEAGVRVFIGRQLQMPFPYEEGMSVSPGFSTAIQLRKVVIGRLDPFENKSCDASTDRFQDSMFARFNVTYSTRACKLSCLAALMKSACGCIWYTLMYNDLPVCDSSNISIVDCTNEVFDKFDHGFCEKKCREKCWEDTFKTSVSLAKWPSRQYKGSLLADIVEHTSDNGTSDISDQFLKLKIYYGELNYEVIEEEYAYTAYSFWSDVGGMMGMWIGISVLTLVELLELTASLLFTLLQTLTKRTSRVVQVNPPKDENTERF